MKRTTDYRWAHIACAVWIPEVFFRSGIGREPIDFLQIGKGKMNKASMSGI